MSQLKKNTEKPKNLGKYKKLGVGVGLEHSETRTTLALLSDYSLACFELLSHSSRTSLRNSRTPLRTSLGLLLEFFSLSSDSPSSD